MLYKILSDKDKLFSGNHPNHFWTLTFYLYKQQF